MKNSSVNASPPPNKTIIPHTQETTTSAFDNSSEMKKDLSNHINFKSSLI